SILCMENKMPMMVFGLNEENSIVKTARGDFHGTRVLVD
ncbi:MAG: UMP kinase, partial [Ruminococcus sp.]